jgi:hypothetical protein
MIAKTNVASLLENGTVELLGNHRRPNPLHQYSLAASQIWKNQDKSCLLERKV